MFSTENITFGYATAETMLLVDDYPIIFRKITPHIMLLFTESDKKDHSTYKTSAHEAIDRLNILGYTLDYVKNKHNQSKEYWLFGSSRGSP